MIKSIFETSIETSGLAYVSTHCVTGLTLPPVDANVAAFHCCFGLPEAAGKFLYLIL